jgi:TetR/AcrR family transcriptional regulator, regulator of cefoperazone and chloramphenicol sensitivity
MRTMHRDPLPPLPEKTHRSDGQEARQRLLDAAMALFAEQGFAKTSTREIAHAAQVNIASISYYFGDKAGLYRAVWSDPRTNPPPVTHDADGQPLPLPQMLDAMLQGFIEPLKQGHLAKQCMKLHIREMLEPTGVWQAEIDSNITPAHSALVDAIGRHLGLAQADDDTHRLAFSLAGLGMMLHVAGDVFAAIRPQLLASQEALDVYRERLVQYGMAMVQAEGQRRALPLVQGLSTAPAAPAAGTLASPSTPSSPSLS